MKKLKSFRVYLRSFFTEGSYRNFLLHRYLLGINIFLFIIFISELIIINIEVENEHYFLHIFHNIELFFGLLFSSELILRLYYVYLPNKIYFKPYIWLNFLVILTLIIPEIFGNLAVLRLTRSLKIIKIYLLNKGQKKELLKNPAFKDKKINKKTI